MDATLRTHADEIARLADSARDDRRWRAEAADGVQVIRAAWVGHHAGSDAHGGLLHDLTETEPRVAPRVNRLRAESLHLIECCDFALAALRRPDAPLGEIRHALRAIVEQERQYSALAVSTTYEAVTVDLGSG